MQELWLQFSMSDTEPSVQAVRNRFYDYLRVRYRRRAAESMWEPSSPRLYPPDGFEEILHRARLTARQSLVLHLRYKESLTWRQIASMTQMSTQTCKNDHAEAKQRIRETLR